MKGKKIYISGGISGIAEEVYKKRFQDAEDMLVKQGYEVVNPCKIDPIVKNPQWEDYMKADIIELCRCDAIYVLEGWKLSRGARVEVNIALTLKLTMNYQVIEVDITKHVSEISIDKMAIQNEDDIEPTKNQNELLDLL